MEAKESPTMVVFRKFNDGGDVIALFPEISATYDGRYCMSYQHVGQHGSADYDGLIDVTTLATPVEYANLAKELQQIGYVLNVKRRALYQHHEKRRTAARESHTVLAPVARLPDDGVEHERASLEAEASRKREAVRDRERECDT